MRNLIVTTLLAATSLWMLSGTRPVSIAPGPEPSGQESAPTERAVLVTGASSGIGRRTAERLAANGFYVYAGARKDKDIAALSALERIEGIRLDVTVPEEIDRAVQTVRDGGRGLYGLVNNAGVLVMAPMIEVTEDDLDFQMDVNVWGPYRVTKAFAPLLIESKGRVTTTGSISGFVTWGLGGPYTMSKHAVEAYTDVLAVEMQQFGVSVSIVEPGNFRSSIQKNMAERMKAKGYGGKDGPYGGRLDRFMKGTLERTDYDEPDAVADAFLAALTDENPRRRYMVTPNQREAEMTIRAALKRVAELNGDHPFSYDEETLHKMLDEALAE